MCSSMKVLSVRATVFLPILVCPRFRISSRTDFKLGNLNMKRGKTLNIYHSCTALVLTSRKSGTHPHATYGSTVFSMATDVLLILTNEPLKIFRSLNIWMTFLTLGLTPLILENKTLSMITSQDELCSELYQYRT